MRESIVQLILFVAIVSVTAVAVGTIVTQSGHLADSIGGESDRRVASLETEVTIINDPATDAYDPDAAGGDGGVVVYVKNVGDETLDPASLDVLLDGEYQTKVNASVPAEDGWRPGATLRVTIPGDPGAGSHRVLVRIHDADARFTFERA
ncbi:flagellin [Halovivax asiaticus JCM 14624]|uniref:Flagellin n=1 Tax=Halovivax asiaticus JCM 14624 TaxID=1227490 RepID=M0BG74_9EURY|nr:flagellin [Halovivax asiaticus]ELZ09303.1 flagellin [Halovivax asiaticus JCM 14624]